MAPAVRDGQVSSCATLPRRRMAVAMADAMTTDTRSAILPAELAAALFADARVVTFDAGQTLFLAGDPCTGCYQMLEGLLKVTLDLPSGRERILAILGPGALVGELSVIDGTPRSACVTAIKPSKLRFVGRAAFDEFGRANPEIFRTIAAVLARRLRDINGALMATSFLSVKGRAARTLLILAEAYGKDVGQGRILIRQKVSQGDLAAMAGIARENLSRVLQDWMEGKLVSRLAGYYCLEDRTALESEAGL
jgi:CRP/FNR family transcriptional regulator, cyclic AMP receptor protein